MLPIITNITGTLSWVVIFRSEGRKQTRTTNEPKKNRWEMMKPVDEEVKQNTHKKTQVSEKEKKADEHAEERDCGVRLDQDNSSDWVDH